MFKQVRLVKRVFQGTMKQVRKRGREAMGKYDNDVKRLLELVGGKENIQESG